MNELVERATAIDVIPGNSSGVGKVFPEFTPYEKEHYGRLAAWRAEFEQLCPNFTSEVRALAGSKQTKPRKKKSFSAKSSAAVRKSGRLAEQMKTAVNNDVCNDGGDRNVSFGENEVEPLNLNNDQEEMNQQLEEQFKCLPCGMVFR